MIRPDREDFEWAGQYSAKNDAERFRLAQCAKIARLAYAERWNDLLKECEPKPKMRRRRKR